MTIGALLLPASTRAPAVEYGAPLPFAVLLFDLGVACLIVSSVALAFCAFGCSQRYRRQLFCSVTSANLRLPCCQRPCDEQVVLKREKSEGRMSQQRREFGLIAQHFAFHRASESDEDHQPVQARIQPLRIWAMARVLMCGESWRLRHCWIRTRPGSLSGVSSSCKTKPRTIDSLETIRIANHP